MEEATDGRSKRGPQKVVLAIALTLLGGALGNGVWEFFLRDLVLAVFSSAAVTGSRLGSAYLDLLHAHIGDDQPLAFSLFASVGLAVGIVLFMPFSIWRVRRSRASRMRATNSTDVSILVVRTLRSGFGLTLFTSLALFEMLLAMHLLGAAIYQHKAVLWAQRSIEIVHPELTEHEYLELRAAYRSVEDAPAFYAVYARLQNLAKSRDLVLPKWSPLGLSGQPSEPEN